MGATEGPVTRDLLNHVRSVEQKLPLLFSGHRILRAPSDGNSTRGKGLSVPMSGWPPASNCMEIEMTSRAFSGQKEFIAEN